MPRHGHVDGRSIGGHQFQERSGALQELAVAHDAVLAFGQIGDPP